jgi:hypothetical protein
MMAASRAGRGFRRPGDAPLETPLGTLAARCWAALQPTSGAREPGHRGGLWPGADIDKRGSWASRSLGIPTRLFSWGIEHSLGIEAASDRWRWSSRTSRFDGRCWGHRPGR